MAIQKIQPADFVNKPVLQGSRELRTQRLRHLLYIFLFIGMALLILVWSPVASSQIKPTLDAIDYSILTGNRVRIELRLSDPVGKPESFSIYNPARIVLDFPGVSLNLAQKTRIINIGLTYSMTAVEAGDRTRVVIQLIRHVPYKMDITDGTIFITIGDSGDAGGPGYIGAPEMGHIEDVAFQKDNAGDGRIHVRLSDPFTVIDTHEEGKSIIVDFFNTGLPKHLHRILDVTDFATPILTIDMFAQGNNTRMVIRTTGSYEHLIYQTQNLQSIELKSIN